MVLRIDSSKTTAGKDAAEAVVVRSAAGMRLLRLVVAGLDPSQKLTSRSPNQLRAGLQRLAGALGFAGLVSWHSCRRGGASDMFCRTGSMEQTPGPVGQHDDSHTLYRGRRCRPRQGQSR